MILTLKITDSLFKNEFQTRKLLSIIRWLIITYTAITAMVFLLMTVFGDNAELVRRITGPYGAMYVLMIFLAAIFPFSLLIRRLGTKVWFLLLVAFLMKMGAYFERFVILTTSLHRDFIPGGGSKDLPWLFVYSVLSSVGQGVGLAILGLGMLRLVTYFKSKTLQ